jgi:LysM repeat protein
MRCTRILVILLLALSGCASPTDGTGTPVPPSVTLPGGLVPYLTSTPAATPTPFLALTQASLPSPTPVTYTVVANDTLIGIAQAFGVSLDALMAANPGVNPNALTVGMVLIIPLGAAATGEPAPTSVPLTVRQTRCYPTADGGMWCLALVENGFAEPVENLSGLFTLIDTSGQEVSSQAAYAPLNIIPPGASMPLGVFFPAPVPLGAEASLQILTANRILVGDQRYLPAVVRNSLVQVDWDGRSAQVTGQVAFASADVTASVVWVLAVAYAADGSLVGFRRWDSAAPATGSVAFDLRVYSLGADIERVDLLIEARP